MEQVVQPSRSDEIYAAVISLTLSVLGIITNGAAIVVIASTKHMHNAFGYVCVSQAVGDLGVLIVFATWVPAKLILSPESSPGFMENERLSYTIGQVTILFYYAAIYTHVLIGLNRYIAIAKPFSYATYFNDHKTRNWIALIWIASFIQSCVYQFDGCHYFFDRRLLLFVSSKALCGQIISLYYEFYVNLVFVIFTVILDILTFFKLKKLSKPMQGIEQATRKRKSHEIRYFIQSVCSETILVLTFVCFWCVATQATTPFYSFLFNIGAWLAMHATDGFIMIAFNYHIFNRLRKKEANRNSLAMMAVPVPAANRRINNNNNNLMLNAQARWLQLCENNKFKPRKLEIEQQHA
uniref:G_PROTEIN_RECEP_F1_2 domain-containing protein n=2 Tax=Onchocerca TaxID=6281 RepID=A0A2K6WBV2_ONCVO